MIKPQLLDVGSPNPKKESPASETMALPVSLIIFTAIKGKTAGKKCFHIRYQAPAPYVSADLI